MIPLEQLFLIDVSLILFIIYEVFISDKIFYLPSVFSILNKFRKNKKNKN